MARLRACDRIVIKRLSGLELRDRNFSFYSVVREYEARLIEQAPAETDGIVTRVAKILKLTHQTLGYMLKRRPKQLQKKRTPAKKRLKSIIKEPGE
jgi:DNA-binding NtrC family response regulator